MGRADMYSVNVKVGRLLEIRLVAPVSIEDIEKGVARIVEFLQKHHPNKLVGVGDFSHATVFPPDVASKVLEQLKVDNPRLERSGILVSQSAFFSLQIEKLLAHAENISRRSFRDPTELKAYLAGLLTQEEQARVSQFFSEKV
ncbi:MAG TPA: hypothetical protein VIG99_10160 [Myxococcaceae bacterium]